jgi:superfamily II DNA/RNA helicase
VHVAAAKLAPDAATLQVASLETIRNNTSTSGDITGVDVIPGDTARIARGVSHSFTVLESNDHKYERLVKILEDRLMEKNKNTSRVVAFCASKFTVDDTTRKLRKHGIPALAMHGDKTQTEREWVLERFRDGTSPVRISHSPHSADATDCPHPSAVSVWVFSQAFGPVRD